MSNPEENNEIKPSTPTPNKEAAPAEASNYPKLVVEGGIPVLYQGVWVKEIPFDRDEITIGVMDPENDIYPDINLRQYRLEGGDPYISRRHSRFFSSEGKYYLEDICKNNSTSVETKQTILNGEKKELHVGTRIFISESIVFRFEESSARPMPGMAKIAAANPNMETQTESKSQICKYYLEVEGEIPLFFKPRNIFTHIIELNPQEWEMDAKDNKRTLHIGRRSTEDGIYPDIDLWKFYFNDGDEYIARRHARIFEQDGKLFFQDVSGKGSTWYNIKDDAHRLVKTENNPAVYEFKSGDKLLISDSAVFVVHEQENAE
jgi:pSer/pThr/pTyr-binding forkhead associated (FHA) protein